MCYTLYIGRMQAFIHVHFSGRIAASDTKAVDWSATENALKSTSNRRLESTSSRRLAAQLATEVITAREAAGEGSTPTRGNSGRRTGGSNQINHHHAQPKSRPTTLP